MSLYTPSFTCGLASHETLLPLNMQVLTLATPRIIKAPPKVLVGCNMLNESTLHSQIVVVFIYLLITLLHGACRGAYKWLLSHCTQYHTSINMTPFILHRLRTGLVDGFTTWVHPSVRPSIHPSTLFHQIEVISRLYI